MRAHLVRLARQGGAYALGNLAVKASGLLLAVLYLDPAYLAQAEFGRLALLEAVARFAMLVVGLGLPMGLLTFAARQLPDDERDSLPATALALTVVLAAVFVGALWPFGASLARWMLDDAARAPVVRLLALYIGLKAVTEIGYAWLRARERPGLFVGAVALEWAVLVGLVAYGLVVRKAGLEGVLTGYVLSAAAAALVLSAGVLRAWPGRIQWSLGKRLILFGAPLVASGLSSRFLNLGDRFLIDHFLGAESVAVYEWASRLGGVLNLFFVQSFQLAFTTIGLKALAAGEGGSGPPSAPLHRKVFRHFAVAGGWASLGLALLCVDVTRLVAREPAYLAVEPLVLLIALGFTAYGLYFVAVNVVFAAGQTKSVASGVVGAAVLNAVLNAVLLPQVGVLGAAVATFAAYAALLAWTARVAERAIHAGYPWRAALVVLGVVLALWAAAQPSAAWSLGARLAWRAGLLALYPPLVVALGVYRLDELRRLWAEMRRLAARLRRAREHAREHEV